MGFTACPTVTTGKVTNAHTVIENSQNSSDNGKNIQSDEKSKDFSDFKNFKYPNFCFGGDTGGFQLKDGNYTDKEGGVMEFSGVNYGDVTGDGNEEALVVLSIYTGGTVREDCVYIFTIENQKNRKLKKLWDFKTGDRADGGLRSIYSENGNLVIERYIDKDKLGACCPQFYNKETFKFDKKAFKKLKEEQFSNPIRGTELIINSIERKVEN